MNSIDVFIYSYKGKNIKDVLSSLINNSSKDIELSIHLIDQHPLNRKDQLTKDYKIRYSHVFWDWQISPCLYKKDAILFSKSKYIMLLSDNVILNQNWDKELINYVDDQDIVVSGNKSIEIKAKNLFYINKEKIETNQFVITNFIDRELIFAKTDTLKKIKYPSYLKYNGEEELLSLLFYINNINIFAAPTHIYGLIGENALETYYAPFSLNHNYNEVIRIFKNYNNKYSDYSYYKDKIKNFSDYHNFDFSSLFPLPFLTNDVEYNPENLNFNKVDARKFVARTKAIH